MANAAGNVSPAVIRELSWGFAPVLILEAALAHGVFEALEPGSCSLEEIVAKTKTSYRGMRAILNALVALSFLHKNQEGSYSLEPISRAFLVSTTPDFQGGLIQHVSKRMQPWLDLQEVVRSGVPVAPLNLENVGAERYRESVVDLFPLSYPASQVLAWALKIRQLTGPVAVLDVAAGSGVWGIGMARASPNVHVTAVDWEAVLPAAREKAARHGVIDRFTFIPGDIHGADFGSGFRLAILGHVLHSEGEGQSRKLLRKVYEALAPQGTIAIAEFLVNEERTAPLLSLIFAVSMLIHSHAGDTFTFGEIRSWLEEAGFVDTRLLEAPGPSPLILATKGQI